LCRAAKRCSGTLRTILTSSIFLEVRCSTSWRMSHASLCSSSLVRRFSSHLTHTHPVYVPPRLSLSTCVVPLSPLSPSASSLPRTMTSNMITGTFQYGTWCSPTDGGIQSEAACMAAAADKGISYANAVASDWHTGCILHGGAFFSSLEILLRNSFCLRSRGASLARLRHSLISPPLLLTTLPTP